MQNIRAVIVEDSRLARQELKELTKEHPEIEIIGEAASQLSETCRRQENHLPWRDIIGMRNRLDHAYFEVDVDVVWAVVASDLPALLPELEKLISSAS